MTKPPRTAEARVLVVGDVMLDRYITGSVDRISPEAPVPVVRVEAESSALGGAATDGRSRCTAVAWPHHPRLCVNLEYTP